MFNCLKHRRVINTITILFASLILATLFSMLRSIRFLSHHNLNVLVEHFGYGLKAFISFFFLSFILLAMLFGIYKRVNPKIFIVFIVAFSGLSFILACNYPSTLGELVPKPQPEISKNKIIIIFTFDTEEDWIRGKYRLNSYKYIDSGAFYQLVDGLYRNNISATFYVTPNLARDNPNLLKYLESRNQTIGAHLHIHQIIDATYPYPEGLKEDVITAYNMSTELKFLKIAKEQIENSLNHGVYIYRSGRLACDYETEKAVRLVGFKAISNHRGTYYIAPIGIWNLDIEGPDLFGSKYSLEDYISIFKKRLERGERIITFTAHPMELYNYTTNNIEESKIKTFFEFVSYLKSQKNIKIINQYRLLQLLEKNKK